MKTKIFVQNYKHNKTFTFWAVKNPVVSISSSNGKVKPDLKNQ